MNGDYGEVTMKWANEGDFARLRLELGHEENVTDRNRPSWVSGTH